MIITNLIRFINDNWNKVAIISESLKAYRYKELAEGIVYYKNVFKIIEKYQNVNITIALIAPNSVMWIIIYLTCLFNKIRLVTIHYNSTIKDIINGLNYCEADVLITTNDIYTGINKSKHLFFTSHFIIIDDDMKIERMSVVEMLYKGFNVSIIANRFKIIRDIAALEKHSVGTEYFYETNFSIKEDDTAIIQYTMGTEGMCKPIELSYGNIQSALKSILADIGYNSDNVAIVSTSFQRFHIFNILYPICNNQKIMLENKNSYINHNPTTIFVDNHKIEQVVKKAYFSLILGSLYDSIYNIPILGNLSRNRLKKGILSQFGTKINTIIVLNGNINPFIFSLLKDCKIQVQETYGLVESSTYVSTDIICSTNGTIVIEGASVAKGYYKSIRFNNRFITSDFINTTTFKIDRQSIKVADKICRYLKDLLYINDCLLLRNEGKIFLLVYPDYPMCDLASLTEEKFDELMNIYKDDINLKLPESEQIYKVIKMPKDFERSASGEILKYLYK